MRYQACCTDRDEKSRQAGFVTLFDFSTIRAPPALSGPQAYDRIQATLLSLPACARRYDAATQVELPECNLLIASPTSKKQQLLNQWHQKLQTPLFDPIRRHDPLPVSVALAAIGASDGGNAKI